MKHFDLTNEKILNLPTHRLLDVYRMVRDEARKDPWNWDNDCSIESESGKFAREIKAELATRGHVDSEQKVTSKTKDPALKPWSGKWHKRWVNHNRPAPVGSIVDLQGAIGKQVYKTSKKPFKSKRAYNTVSGVTINPHTKRDAFTFEEDGSVVDCHICKLRDRK